MNKETRQKKLLALIQQDKPMTALELAQALNVSKRTILRDMQELEGKGVQIVAHAGCMVATNFKRINITIN